ncbi:lipoate-protein ligase 2, putative [Plasmodium berghei]|uniref:Lipoate-protein ligase 2 n=2 Tax=Plasmodium berghei TaxID=5821 RepID=A0A509ANY3_PLABA|nr:lipoate-protein ligase 2 [Plasmodium berghei ANKA]CXI34528.1 lipoate-protein ligase 2, putative [Plasmodium berghei]SCM21389.1 lipoate-protein ligase 2, putative [Plasmodium berghei]SCN24631.1 lipoate-protein ligase 2, putative [Plasmodium berghei]SCO59792.1 lipoate-protein ligase 2, putative [Plasmodium berghei]SCO61056.1 lipoate-protein ligase 2, putative [Plasmodium berghei]|eukprot:XP_034421217.1 lipoate-protein ligase 2 [Plasmodium berghei ANKA]
MVKNVMKKIVGMADIFQPIFTHTNNNNNNSKIQKNILYFINLTNFHIYEQLLIEESLYRLSSCLSNRLNKIGFFVINDTTKNIENNNKIRLYSNNYSPNNKCVIFGMNRKTKEHTNDTNYIKKNNILLIKRFTGGGTVYINSNCILTSFILPNDFEKETRLYPSNISKWTFDYFFKPFIQKKNNGRYTFNKTFQYHEQDFVCKINDNYETNDQNVIIKKVGGNAQAFSKDYFVHHTSFIWNLNEFEEIENVLSNPLKQPIYRDKRNHKDFIASINSCLHKNIDTPDIFIQHLVTNIKHVLHKKNKLNTEEIWLFNNIQFNNNEHNLPFSTCDIFDHIYTLDLRLLKEIVHFYINNNNLKNLRSTYFLDIYGNKVSESFYNFNSFIIN